MEPRGLTELAHGLQEKKRVALHAPSPLAAQHPREHVGDRVNIRRNVQAPPQQVVAGIDPQRTLFGGRDLAQADDKLRASGPAAQNTNHAALRASQSAPDAARTLSASNPGF